MLNPDAPASNYSNGLDGVDQATNWLVSNIAVSTFVLLLLCVLLYRAIDLGHAHLRHIVSLGGEADQRYWMQNQSPFWALCKKNLFYAPLGKIRHNRELQLSKAISVGTLPGRFHTLVIVLYCLSNLVYCLALDWNSYDATAIAELRGRSGQLAALNLIPTVLFALRNNPLIYLTRVSYDTFNLMHRWAARIVVVESVVHTICWGVNNIRSGGTDQVDAGLSTSISFQFGMAATCALALIFLTSPSPVRHAFYELFLNSHRTLALVALIGIYVHLERAHLPQLPYIQVVFVFWGAELGFRYWKIYYHNLSARTGITKVTVEMLPAEACRVTFDLRRPWRYTPGCHIHAFLPTMGFWSSHPFSVAWAENTLAEPRQEMEMEKLTPLGASDLVAEARRGSVMPQKAAVTQGLGLGAHKTGSGTAWSRQGMRVDRVSLVCRARAGFTRKMYDKASKSTNRSFTTWGFVEGPYGGNETFASYGTVVVFAGGVGITHCVGHVHHLLRLYEAGLCSTRRILLVWSVPNTECLEWVRVWMDQILHMESRREVLRIQLFVTKPRHRGEVISNTGSVQMFPGRCDPKTILEKEMEQRIGAMAVTVCGPGAFADSVRAAARGVVTDGSVDFVEEAFTY